MAKKWQNQRDSRKPMSASKEGKVLAEALCDLALPSLIQTDQRCVRPAYRGAILRKLRIITKKMNRDEPGKFYTETTALRKLIEDAYQSLTNK